MRALYRDLLSSLGYVPLVAKSGRDALRLLSVMEDEVAIVVTDYVMPNMDGVSLAARVKCRYPSLPVLLVTSSPQLSDDPAHCVDAVLEKPCPPQRIVDHIRSLLKGQSDRVETEA